MFRAILRMSVVLTIFVVMIFSTPAQAERYCGAVLLQTMEFLCRGKFQGMTGPARKRSQDQFVPHGLADISAEDEAVLFNFQPDHHERFRRSQPMPWVIEHGIVEECCSNPCSIGTMMSYCKIA